MDKMVSLPPDSLINLSLPVLKELGAQVDGGDGRILWWDSTNHCVWSRISGAIDGTGMSQMTIVEQSESDFDQSDLDMIED